MHEASLVGMHAVARSASLWFVMTGCTMCVLLASILAWASE